MHSNHLKKKKEIFGSYLWYERERNSASIQQIMALSVAVHGYSCQRHMRHSMGELATIA